MRAGQTSFSLSFTIRGSIVTNNEWVKIYLEDTNYVLTVNKTRRVTVVTKTLLFLPTVYIQLLPVITLRHVLIFHLTLYKKRIHTKLYH